jgi:hypothetical protein
MDNQQLIMGILNGLKKRKQGAPSTSGEMGNPGKPEGWMPRQPPKTNMPTIPSDTPTYGANNGILPPGLSGVTGGATPEGGTLADARVLPSGKAVGRNDPRFGRPAMNPRDRRSRLKSAILQGLKKRGMV